MKEPIQKASVSPASPDGLRNCSQPFTEKAEGKHRRTFSPCPHSRGVRASGLLPPPAPVPAACEMACSLPAALSASSFPLSPACLTTTLGLRSQLGTALPHRSVPLQSAEDSGFPGWKHVPLRQRWWRRSRGQARQLLPASPGQTDWQGRAGQGLRPAPGSALVESLGTSRKGFLSVLLMAWVTFLHNPVLYAVRGSR